MYDLFELKRIGKAGSITGYHWGAEDPHHVVALIHGIGEYAGRYDRVAGYFREAGVATVAMDLRGHGRSGGRRGNCAPREAILKDVDELIEYAQIRYPGVPVVLYGHSMGGNIALDYRGRGKYNGDLSAYIITSPWLVLANEFPTALVKTLSVICKVAPGMTVSTHISSLDLGNLKLVGNVNEDPLVHTRISLQCTYDGFFMGEALAEGTNEDNGRAKGIPMLLMHGTADRLCDVEGSRLVAEREAADTEFVVWPGYFHEIHNGNKEVDGEEVILKMVEFLNGLK